MIKKTINRLLLGFILLSACSLVWLLGTSSGAHVLMKEASHYIPGKLTIAKVKGSLLNDLQLQDINYTNAGSDIHIKKLTFNWQPWDLLHGRFTLDKIDIEGLVFKTNSNHKSAITLANTTLALKGTISLRAPHTVNLQLKQSTSLAPQQSLKTLTNITGNSSKVVLDTQFQPPFNGTITTTLTTPLSHLSWSTVAKLIIPAHTVLPKGTWEMAANGDTQKLSDIKLDADTLAGTIKASGHANWKQPAGWHFILNAKQLNPGKQWQAWPGKINFQFITSGKQQKNALQASYQLQKLTGKLNGYPISGAATVSQKSQKINFNTIVKSASSQLKISGTWNKQINTNFSLHSPNLATVLPQASGSLTLTGKLNGTTQHAKLRINAESKHIVYRQLPISDSSLKVNLNLDNNVLNLSSLLQANHGALKLTGNLYTKKSNSTSTLSLAGKDFQLLDGSQYQVTISPNLTLTLKGRRLDLTGELIVPSASLKPTDFTSTTTLPDDVIFVSKKRKEMPALPYDTYLNVKINLGQKVNIDTSGLVANIGGNIALHSAPKLATTADGELKITQGSFTAYGQKLDISKGRLIFTGGPIANPGLSINATKSVTKISQTKTDVASNDVSSAKLLPSAQKIAVGVNVSGTLKNPKISLISNPAGLSQKDILSYMILGKPADKASEADLSSLITLLSALNIDGGRSASFKDKLQKKVGLDEMTIGQQANYDPKNNTVEENTSVVLGKALTSRLFVSYSIGILDPINTFNVRYQLNKHFSLQGQTNSLGSGADILYTLEKN